MCNVDRDLLFCNQKLYCKRLSSKVKNKVNRRFDVANVIINTLISFMPKLFKKESSFEYHLDDIAVRVMLCNRY